jgi:hypothetical protein
LEELLMGSATTPAVRTNQLARRQPSSMPEVLTREEEAIIRVRQIQDRILTERERLNKRGIETDAEMLLQTNAVFTEMAAEMVHLKNSIENEETRTLSAGFSQYLLSDLHEEMKTLLRIGMKEVERVVETDLSKVARPRTIERQKLTLLERLKGEAWVARD